MKQCGDLIGANSTSINRLTVKAIAVDGTCAASHRNSSATCSPGGGLQKRGQFACPLPSPLSCPLPYLLPCPLPPSHAIPRPWPSGCALVHHQWCRSARTIPWKVLPGSAGNPLPNPPPLPWSGVVQEVIDSSIEPAAPADSAELSSDGPFLFLSCR